MEFAPPSPATSRCRNRAPSSSEPAETIATALEDASTKALVRPAQWRRRRPLTHFRPPSSLRSTGSKRPVDTASEGTQYKGAIRVCSDDISLIWKPSKGFQASRDAPQAIGQAGPLRTRLDRLWAAEGRSEERR